MELIASLFCHVPEGLPETEVQQELQRQHDMLAQHAAHTGRAIEHCFFHVGEFNFEKPDEVLLRFLQRAQANDLGLIFVESKEVFPLVTASTHSMRGGMLCARGGTRNPWA